MNLAFGRATDQSSTNNYNSTVRGVSGNAVDGNPDTDFGSGHCSRTNAANPSWWRVDLGANLVPVSDVFIVNSNEQQGNKDYKITLGEYIYKLKHVFRVDSCGGCVVAIFSLQSTVEPQFYPCRFKYIPDLTINILFPSNFSYSNCIKENADLTNRYNFVSMIFLV